MEHPDWNARWRDGQIAFHQSCVSASLKAYADRVWPDTVGRILVPLCGKTLDMVFLAERADAVVGVEYVEQAVGEFFAERRLSPQVERTPHTRYRADRYTLFAADFFALEPEDLGVIDAVFDRASLVALDAEARNGYAAHMRSILPPGARMLLISFDYDQTKMEGPPFSVPPDDVGRLFQDGFHVEHLATRDMLDDMFRMRGLAAMRETVFALTRR